jgi:sensor histidine kinase YesM
MGASAKHQVSLAEEIEFVDRYVAIQKVRLADRLQFAVSVPPELLSAQVPSFLLQPVVENAIVHGIAKRVQGGSIRISAARDNGTLTLVVYNDGPALPADSNAMRSGIGIANLRERLRTLYGPAFTVNMTEQSTSGMAVSISLPFRG